MSNVSNLKSRLRPNQFLLPSGILITEHPILFQTELVRANLEDRKTQTRRTVKPEIPDDKHTPWNHRDSIVWQWQSGKANVNHKEDERQCPYGKPGDLLWVKETWCKPLCGDAKTNFLSYKADFSIEILSREKNRGIWKPSIHLPKAASRIWAMVEDIRVERVQDISEEDAIAEGIESWVETRMKSQPTHYKVYTESDPEALYTSCPIDSFETLWKSINGEDSWNANPWVWVIKYRILSKTGRPSLEVIEQAYSEVCPMNYQASLLRASINDSLILGSSINGASHDFIYMDGPLGKEESDA